MKEYCLSVILVFTLVSCTSVEHIDKDIIHSENAAQKPPVHMKSTYNEEEVVSALRPTGNNVIKGIAFVTTKEDTHFTSGDRKVLLIPATAYTTEAMTHIYGNAEKGFVPYGQNPEFSSDGPSPFKDARTVQADDTGNFVFDNVRDGGYYVVTNVIWEESISLLVGSIGKRTRGGSLMCKATVSGGRTTSITLLN
jgi:hypothetical protein